MADWGVGAMNFLPLEITDEFCGAHAKNALIHFSCFQSTRDLHLWSCQTTFLKNQKSMMISWNLLGLARNAWADVNCSPEDKRGCGGEIRWQNSFPLHSLTAGHFHEEQSVCPLFSLLHNRFGKRNYVTIVQYRQRGFSSSSLLSPQGDTIPNLFRDSNYLL